MCSPLFLYRCQGEVRGQEESRGRLRYLRSSLGRGGDSLAALDRMSAFAPDPHPAPHVDHVEPGALQDRGREAAALAAAADRRDRPVAGQLVEAPAEVAVGDVEGAGDVLGLI